MIQPSNSKRTESFHYSSFSTIGLLGEEASLETYDSRLGIESLNVLKVELLVILARTLCNGIT